MFSESENSLISKTVMISRIIAGALIAGCLMFAGVACVLVSQRNVAAEAGDILIPAILAGISFVSFVAINIVQSVMSSANNKPQSVEQACQQYQTKTLIWSAGLEGACFVNIIAYIVSGVWWSMAIAGLFVAIMIATFPSQTALKFHLESNTFE